MGKSKMLEVIAELNRDLMTKQQEMQFLAEENKRLKVKKSSTRWIRLHFRFYFIRKKNHILPMLDIILHFLSLMILDFALRTAAFYFPQILYN